MGRAEWRVVTTRLVERIHYADEIRAILEPLAGRLKSLVVATCLAGDPATLQDDGACGEQVVSARQGMHLV